MDIKEIYDQENPELKMAEEYVKFTSKNIFLTGKAGTGKTTFLKKIVKESNKRSVVVAPTGVAALNAGGVTIHSFFQLPFGMFIPELGQDKTFQKHKLNKNKLTIIRSLELLIIDEISMVRADLLDEIDNRLKTIRHSPLPFGGVQLLMIGDMLQLPPVVKEPEWRILSSYYNSPYFFDAQVFKSQDLKQENYIRQIYQHLISSRILLRSHAAMFILPTTSSLRSMLTLQIISALPYNIFIDSKMLIL